MNASHTNKSKIPTVSVLMPAYNVEKYIGEAIESILNQTYKDFEFIIIDDCSTDNTWKIIQTYANTDKRIRIFRNNLNLKICACLNIGINNARGRYIARMDGDDWSMPDRLEKQLNFLKKNESIGIVGGSVFICNEDLNYMNIRRYNLTDQTIRLRLFRYSPYAHPSVMYRTDIAKRIQGYSELFDVAQDYDFYFRLGQYCEFGNLDSVVLKLRTHPNSSSQKKGKKQEINTLIVRLHATIFYNYRMTFVDKIYFFLQLICIYIIPYKLKFKMFNFIRSFK